MIKAKKLTPAGAAIGRGRPRSNQGAPQWFNLTQYADASRMDVADWYLNLALRFTAATSKDDFWTNYIRQSPILRRRAGVPIEFFGAKPVFGVDFIRVLHGKEPHSGVNMLRGDELYFFEKRLPQPIRDFGGTFKPGKSLASEAPVGFSGPIDHLFEKQLLQSFARIDLNYPDAILLQHLKEFLAQKRADLERIGGPQPFQKALMIVEPKQRPRLNVWARRALLPYFDLDQWRMSAGNQLADAEVDRLLGITEMDRRQTQRDIAQLRQPMVLQTWLLPLVRAAIREQAAAGD